MLAINDTQLVILDIQGKLSEIVYQSEQVLKGSSQLIQGSRLLNLPIVWVEQTPEKLGATHSSLVPHLEGLSPLSKATFSAYRTEAIAKAIEDNARKQVLLIGVETHICIYQTTADLVKAGYEVFVVADAVSSRTMENKNIGLKMVKQAGGKISCVEGALFSLLGGSTHEKFREIAKLIK